MVCPVSLEPEQPCTIQTQRKEMVMTSRSHTAKPIKDFKQRYNREASVLKVNTVGATDQV